MGRTRAARRLIFHPQNNEESDIVSVKFIEDKIIHSCPLSHIQGRHGMREGDVRQVKWTDSFFYLAKIDKIRADRKVDVIFVRDKVKYRAALKDVRGSTLLRAGDIRRVKWKDGQFYNAKILKIGRRRCQTQDVLAAETNGEITKTPNRIFQEDETNTSISNQTPSSLNKHTHEDLLAADNNGGRTKASNGMFQEDETNTSISNQSPSSLNKHTHEDLLAADNNGERTEAPIRIFQEDENSTSISNQSPSSLNKNTHEDILAAANIGGRTKAPNAIFQEDETNTSINNQSPSSLNKNAQEDLLAADNIGGRIEAPNGIFQEDETESSIGYLSPTPLFSEGSDDLDKDVNYVPDDSYESSESSASKSSSGNLIKDPRKLLHKRQDPKVTSAHDPASPCLSIVSRIRELTSKRGIESEEYCLDVPEFNEEKELGSTRKAKKNRNFCYYCEELVLDFSRHLMRNHTNEVFVQQIMAAQKGKERNDLLSEIRKKGNYINATIGVIKQVRKPVVNSPSKAKACKYCLGFYSRRQMWRHVKSCTKNSKRLVKQVPLEPGILLPNVSSGRMNLITQVFSRMQYNLANQTAKKDNLICAYGIKFLKTHKQAHQAIVCSRKMRELALVLIELKQINEKISNLSEGLKPEYFDSLVQAARNAAGYDPDKGTFRDASFAINISTSLKECCEILILNAVKKKHSNKGPLYEKVQAEVNTTLTLIKSQWRTELSHEATEYMHLKKAKKPSMVPLASDLKVLKSYLLEKGNQAAKQLEDDEQNDTAFKNLVASAYCRVILLCRKRPGELQRMLISDYETHFSAHSYDEFKNCISPTESVLLKSLKRCVIVGKRRPTPVLFTKDVQQHVDLLLKVRPNYVPSTNLYLFPQAHSENPILGYRVLRNYAEMAGCTSPAAITTRGLRKHLATICQLFQMTDTDIEQLSTFMGHTANIHRSNYRLPDDVFQTSKIAKLLLMMENGEGSQFKDKRLDEIEINLDCEEDKYGGDSSESDSEAGDKISIEDIAAPLQKQRQDFPKSNRKKKAPTEKHKWSQEEKEVVRVFFSEEIIRMTAPKKNRVIELYKQYPNLNFPKNWATIKVMVQNIITKKLKS